MINAQQVPTLLNRKGITRPVKRYPAVFITFAWIICMVVLRFFVVSAMHQPGNHELNPNIKTTIIGAVKWDAVYYLRIVENGYDINSSNMAFYPGFPLAVRALAYFKVGPVLVGQIINLLMLLIATQGLYALTLLIAKKRRIAILATLAWLAFPSAHFFIAFYTESLIVALSVWSLVFVVKRQYIPAVILASLASFTRAAGVVLGLVILLQYFIDINWSWRKIDWKILLLPISFFGIGCYWVWIYLSTDTLPWRFFSEMYQKFWPYMRFEPNILRTIYSEVVSMVQLINSTSWQDLWVSELFTKLHFFVAWLAIVYAAWKSWTKKLPMALTAYCALTALILILTGNFVSDSRYILPVFPVFILIAMWLDKQAEWVRTLYFVVSAIALGAMLTMFSNGYWVG